MTKLRIPRQLVNNGGRVNESNSQAKQSDQWNLNVYGCIA